MRLNPKIPLSDKFQARLAAQALVRNGFNLQATVKELRPDIVNIKKFGQTIMKESAVQYEVEKIMNRTENDAKKFLKMMWGWAEKLDGVLNSETPVTADKATVEAGLSAARILAKGYINEKAPAVELKPMIIEGLENSNLTGEKVM